MGRTEEKKVRGPVCEMAHLAFTECEMVDLTAQFARWAISHSLNARWACLDYLAFAKCEVWADGVLAFVECENAIFVTFSNFGSFKESFFFLGVKLEKTPHYSKPFPK